MPKIILNAKYFKVHSCVCVHGIVPNYAVGQLQHYLLNYERKDMRQTPMNTSALALFLQANYIYVSFIRKAETALLV